MGVPFCALILKQPISGHGFCCSGLISEKLNIPGSADQSFLKTFLVLNHRCRDSEMPMEVQFTIGAPQGVLHST